MEPSETLIHDSNAIAFPLCGVTLLVNAMDIIKDFIAIHWTAISMIAVFELKCMILFKNLYQKNVLTNFLFIQTWNIIARWLLPILKKILLNLIKLKKFMFNPHQTNSNVCIILIKAFIDCHKLNVECGTWKS